MGLIYENDIIAACARECGSSDVFTEEEKVLLGKIAAIEGNRNGGRRPVGQVVNEEISLDEAIGFVRKTRAFATDLFYKYGVARYTHYPDGHIIASFERTLDEVLQSGRRNRLKELGGAASEVNLPLYKCIGGFPRMWWEVAKVVTFLVDPRKIEEIRREIESVGKRGDEVTANRVGPRVEQHPHVLPGWRPWQEHTESGGEEFRYHKSVGVGDLADYFLAIGKVLPAK